MTTTKRQAYPVPWCTLTPMDAALCPVTVASRSLSCVGCRWSAHVDIYKNGTGAVRAAPVPLPEFTPPRGRREPIEGAGEARALEAMKVRLPNLHGVTQPRETRSEMTSECAGGLGSRSAVETTGDGGASTPVLPGVTDVSGACVAERCEQPLGAPCVSCHNFRPHLPEVGDGHLMHDGKRPGCEVCAQLAELMDASEVRHA